MPAGAAGAGQSRGAGGSGVTSAFRLPWAPFVLCFPFPEVCASASCIPGPFDGRSALVSLDDPWSHVPWEILPCDFKTIIIES